MACHRLDLQPEEEESDAEKDANVPGEDGEGLKAAVPGHDQRGEPVVVREEVSPGPACGARACEGARGGSAGAKLDRRWTYSMWSRLRRSFLSYSEGDKCPSVGPSLCKRPLLGPTTSWSAWAVMGASRGLSGVRPGVEAKVGCGSELGSTGRGARQASVLATIWGNGLDELVGWVGLRVDRRPG